MRQWCHVARLDLSGPCAPSPLAVSTLKAARLVIDPAIRRLYGNESHPEQPPDAIQPVLCIYCRTDKFVYWPLACRLPSTDCPSCQRRTAKPAAILRWYGWYGAEPIPGDRTRSGRPASRCSPHVWCHVQGPAQAAIASLKGYPGSEQPGLLARLTTRLLPITAARDPGGTSTSPAAMCLPGVPQCNPVNQTWSRPASAPTVSRPHVTIACGYPGR
jgi:hypothetical protein